MRTRTISLAAIAALGLSVPAYANDYVGTVDLGFGWTVDVNDVNDNTSLDDDSYPLVEGAARGNIPLSDNFAIQLDAGGLGTFTDRDNGEDNLQTVFFGAAHANWRNDNMAIGAFSQVGSSKGANDENATFYNFGGEAAFHFGNFTVIPQAGYFWADDESANDVMTDAWWARGVARFYAGPNTRFQAEGSYGDGDESDEAGVDVTAIGWGARIDHSFGSGPVAVFVGYKGTNVESDDGNPEEITEHTVSIGLNLRFGAGSIQDADRRGPAFDTPDIGRWTGWTGGIVD